MSGVHFRENCSRLRGPLLRLCPPTSNEIRGVPERSTARAIQTRRRARCRRRNSSARPSGRGRYVATRRRAQTTQRARTLGGKNSASWPATTRDLAPWPALPLGSAQPEDDYVESPAAHPARAFPARGVHPAEHGRPTDRPGGCAVAAAPAVGRARPDRSRQMITSL